MPAASALFFSPATDGVFGRSPQLRRRITCPGISTGALPRKGVNGSARCFETGSDEVILQAYAAHCRAGLAASVADAGKVDGFARQVPI